MEKKVEVRNLRVSFRTNNGTVKAVRDISFDLNKGETLAIVGESGSGKSVTAKAMLGILASNAIVESGEIIYDGQDLLKLSKKELSRIRGNKVTMIFQDPMSSLDPIMKIGKQLTEATLLNGKTNCKISRRKFQEKVKELKQAMLAAGCDAKKVNDQIREFVKFVEAGSKLERSYRLAHEYAESSVMSIDHLLIVMLGNDNRHMKETLKGLNAKLEKTYNEFLFRKGDNTFSPLAQEIGRFSRKYKGGNDATLRELLEKLRAVLSDELAKEEPNFFTMGYYILHEGKAKLFSMEISEMNQMLRDYVDSNFMLEFLGNIAKGLEYSENAVIDAKKRVVAEIERKQAVFEKETLDIKECRKAVEVLQRLVDSSIDRLALHKNSSAYTFRTTMENNLERYALGLKQNSKDYAIDLELTRQNMLRALKDIAESYRAELTATGSRSYDALAVDMVDYLKEQSYAMVNVITNQMAYDRAIRIMEDVGIKEPRKRFNQYPFEFSGGMRQRIVIAIALAANPDVLICDEPTTALDVTIQAQILELINDLKHKRNLSVIFITHDLGVVANMADQVAVMYAGKIVEHGTVDDIFFEPTHPYTWALLASMPDLDTKEKLEAIPGTPPNMIYPPVGDAFAARNKYALQIDFKKQPPMFKISDTHCAATWLLDPKAPKINPPQIVLDRIKRMKKLEEQADGQ